MSEQDDSTPRFPFSINGKALAIVAVVILLLGMITTSFFVVDQTEEAVVLRLGRYHRTAAPGLHFKLPLGMEQNYNVPTQAVQNMQFGFRLQQPGVTSVMSQRDYKEESLMLTGDLNIVDVEWIIQYRITNPTDWLFNVEDQERTIRDISQSTVNRLVGDRAIIDVLSDERPAIELFAQDQMNDVFQGYNLGVTVTAVRLQNIVPPSGRVQDAFEDVNRAIQDMNRLINEGREAYNREIPRARGEAEQMVQIARGYAAERVNRARGDASRFVNVLREYRNDPRTTRTRLYYEMVEDVFIPDDSSQEPERPELIDRNLSNFIPLLNMQRQGLTTGGAR
ncbi:membrane protease subunit HflK [Alkalispirochaeta americana]|uniref:Protein HflK n=1 Tax=Alkalispirochaeta americana TaxID=159291 RepID=A0A1N6NBU5_9SPIO|nr:FtsH protease activity modulator HflK [Alkalispirochaeta americana]SIP89492.1 membrane protease subunit HflK [Alkalispirochaeta americana]